MIRPGELVMQSSDDDPLLTPNVWLHASLVAWTGDVRAVHVTGLLWRNQVGIVAAVVERCLGDTSETQEHAMVIAQDGIGWCLSWRLERVRDT